ncbi:MAG: hypothetical protein JNJ60_21455 [Rhodocyclaceae bacterium]|nr:hypothetical protein [Rhodocyclaceae bacterium]
MARQPAPATFPLLAASRRRRARIALRVRASERLSVVPVCRGSRRRKRGLQRQSLSTFAAGQVPPRAFAHAPLYVRSNTAEQVRQARRA